MSLDKIEYQNLLNDLVALIEKTKIQVVSYANSSLTVLFWHIGKRILTHNLQNKRAEYGKQIVVTLSRHLSWSHFIALIPIKEQQARNFYAKITFESSFGVRELRKQIEKKVYERTKKADIQLFDSKVIDKGIFKDPYLLDFLELKDGYLENDLAGVSNM